MNTALQELGLKYGTDKATYHKHSKYITDGCSRS